VALAMWDPGLVEGGQRYSLPVIHAYEAKKETRINIEALLPEGRLLWLLGLLQVGFGRSDLDLTSPTE
jgi:hypothetical protein